MKPANRTSGGLSRRRFTAQKRKTFLAHLAETSNVAASARKARIDASTVYKLRQADPSFAQAWFAALCEGYDNLEMDLLRRLRDGELEQTKTTARRKYDNATAFRLLSAHRVSVGRERGRNDFAHEDAILASIDAKLARMRERRLANEATPRLPPPATEPDDQ